MKKVYVQEKEGLIYIGNDRVELGFNPAKNGALTSLVDKKTGYQFYRDNSVPVLLYRLVLRKQSDRELELIDSSQASLFRWSREEKDGRVILSLITSGFSGRDLKVKIDVALEPDSALSVWHMTVQNPGSAAVYRMTCPVFSGFIRLGEPVPGETLVVPMLGEGYLFKNPYPVRDRLPLCSGQGPETADVGIGHATCSYPGNLSMQMYALYNDKAGLYFAAHDAGENVKEFAMGTMDGCGQFPVLSMSHFPGEITGADVEISYDTIVGVFHGDWHDAADIYKSWATKQWWCEKKLWDRNIGDSMRAGFAVFQMSNYHIPELKLNHSMAQIADVVNGLSREAGVPLAALIFNFEAGGAWTGPIGLLPPREGEDVFRKAMERLRKEGNYGFVYIPGGNWYIKLPYDPPFDSSREFEAQGKPCALKDSKGTVPIGRWYAGWEGAGLCPHTEYTRDIAVSMLTKCLELGCSIVQIDNFPCVCSQPCYDKSHGHPLGHGPWWSQAWREILAEVRRQAKDRDPHCIITTEGISENFIPYLDMYDNRSGNMEYFGHYWQSLPMGAEIIPLFNYVYNEYIGSYCAALPECNRPEVLYWTRCFGKALTEGIVPTGGWYFPEPDKLNPVTIGFYKKIARAAAQECWQYIMFGEMLRRPEIKVPEITAQYCKFICDEKNHYMDPKQRHEVKDSAVQHGVFRGMDGSIGYIFVNVSEETISFPVELSSYGMNAGGFDIEWIIDGTRKRRMRGTRLPRRVRIKMSPLSITMVKISKAKPVKGCEQ